MKVTAKDIAKKLNLSTASVSMALNNKPGVSELTRELVLQTAKEMGYDFSKIQNTTRTAGKIVYIIYRKHGAVVGDTPFFEDLTEGIIRSARQRSYQLEIRYMFEHDSIDEELQEIQKGNYDGIILLGTEMKEKDFLPFQNVYTPLVVLDTYFETLNRCCVLINNVQGAYTATKYLIAKTQKQPGYLCSSYSIGNFEERADGYYKAIREHGYSSSQCIVHTLAPSVEGAYADMLEILNNHEKIAPCYFCDNDLIAIGAMKAFKEKGYRIPQDVGFVGFDNSSLCELFEPSLTTINVPKYEIGQLVIRQLHHLIHHPTSPITKIEVQTNLIRRNSL